MFLHRIAYAPEHETPARPHQREAVEAIERGLSPGTPGLVHVATGGGKTRIANDYLARRFARPESGWVLWVTKGWGLLEQAATDLSRRHPGWTARLARWGGDGTPLHPLPEGPRAGAVVYTTLASLRSRLGKLGRLGPPTLVVWDECHWGAESPHARPLWRWASRGGTCLLGLTATPRRGSGDRFRVLYSRAFPELVADRLLAAPVAEIVSTGVDWDPELSSLGDVAPRSLRELAVHAGRNRQVVAQYRRHADRYGKTLVFACGVDHAETLAALLRREGVPARAVHSSYDEGAVRETLELFQRGQIRVLVSVEKLATGFDAPDVRTVFLVRPTFSDILFSQMVGRGSRLHAPSGKRSFHLVEFTDNLRRHGDLLVRPRGIFGAPGGTPGRRTVPARSPRRVRSDFDPRGQPLTLPESGDDVPAALHGLWTRKGQTFGLEFELTSDTFDGRMSEARWRETAEPLREALAEALPGLVAAECLPEHRGIDDKNHDVWNVERDNSCGWEVTTRVLEGEAGMREVVDGLAALRAAAVRLDLKVNWRTGTHVHLGWMGESLSQVQRALALVRLFEPALATLVSPSRIVRYRPSRGDYDLASPNDYCRPLSSVFSGRRLKALRSLEELHDRVLDGARRYVSFNLHPLHSVGTMEVRLHNGTLDAGKILLWLSLWQQLLWAAENEAGLPPVPGVRDASRLLPTGDVLALAEAWLPWSSTTFRERLHARRLEVRAQWERHPSLALWTAFASGWAVPGAPTAA